MTFDTVVERVTTLISTFGVKALGSVVILLLGFWLVRFLRPALEKILARSRLDETIVHFLSSLVSYALLAFILIAALQNLGVATSSFVAVLGAAGLAIGLAMEGALANLAAGVLIAIFRPFKVGDWLAAADAEGQVQGITIFHTTLVSLDNETIVVPNSEMTSGCVTNFSAKEYVRVEIPLMIGHEASFEDVRKILLEVPGACSRVLAEPPAEVQVTELAETGVKLQVEVSVAPKDREDAVFQVAEEIKRRFDAAGVTAPKRRVEITMGASGLAAALGEAPA